MTTNTQKSGQQAKAAAYIHAALLSDENSMNLMDLQWAANILYDEMEEQPFNSFIGKRKQIARLKNQAEALVRGLTAMIDSLPPDAAV